MLEKFDKKIDWNSVFKVKYLLEMNLILNEKVKVGFCELL